MVKEQKLETSDATIGIKLEVKNNDKNRYNKVYFDKKLFSIGEVVFLLSEQEHQLLTTHQKNIDVEYWKKKLDEKDSEITSLKSKVSELKQSLKETNKNNKSIDAYKQELQTKYEIIDNLTTSRNDYKSKYDNLQKTTTTTINQLKARIDELGKQLDNSADASELEDLQQKLNDAKKDAEYWQESYGTLSDEHLGIVDENESLRKSNEDINKTNKLLNANITSLKTTFDETKEQLTSDYEKQEKELKETIKNKESHIDELTEKYQSLLPLKEYIPQKQHYKELSDLQSKLNNAKNELDKTNADVESKLATQKSELEIQHTNEKAQLLVTYNQNINQHKMKYNELAMDYNHLLNDVCSLSRINTLLNGKHNDIVKDKTPVELEVIVSEQLPPSDEDVMEYVPKNEKQE